MSRTNALQPRLLRSWISRGADVLTGLPVGDQEMLELLSALHTRMPKQSRWTLGIISTAPGEGVSSIARGLARVAARNPETKVLICDVQGGASQRGSRDEGSPSVMVETVAWLPGEQVAVGSLGEPAWIDAMAVDASSARSVVGSLSATFQLVILELPPASVSITGPALTRVVDGVLIVVEAERTRRRTLQATRKAIEKHGGNIVGLVLNKRRFHIPNFIYNRL
jgi:Mrp family chromosome partitioning ATPase